MWPGSVVGQVTGVRGVSSGSRASGSLQGGAVWGLPVGPNPCNLQAGVFTNSCGGCLCAQVS